VGKSGVLSPMLVALAAMFGQQIFASVGKTLPAIMAPLVSSLNLRDKFPDAQNFFTCGFKPLRTTALDFTLTYLQGGMNRSFKCHAFGRFDFEVKNWLVGRTSVNLRNDALYDVIFGCANLQPVRAAGVSICIDRLNSLSALHDV
jgi:hypothetical protein